MPNRRRDMVNDEKGVKYVCANICCFRRCIFLETRLSCKLNCFVTWTVPQNIQLYLQPIFVTMILLKMKKKKKIDIRTDWVETSDAQENEEKGSHRY